LKDSALVAELRKLGAVRVKEVSSLGQLRANPTAYIGTISFSGTSAGTATNPGNVVGSNSTTFARFQATGTIANPQSILAVYDFGSAVSGTVWVLAKLGPSANTSSQNNVVVIASNTLGTTWTNIGTDTVTAANTSAGAWYIGNASGSYRYYAVGATGMGGSNPSSDICVYILQV
jgi:hypothetical protein